MIDILFVDVICICFSIMGDKIRRLTEVLVQFRIISIVEMRYVMVRKGFGCNDL
jgi:hypothetical protein